ncbi:MAG: DUF465 domain-containing protein [Gammaproteobacteria bacterium]
MFEKETAAVQTLLHQDASFRRLYDKHATLNAQVDEITSGDQAKDPLDLELMKKEKLHLADRMNDIIRDFKADH